MIQKSCIIFLVEWFCRLKFSSAKEVELKIFNYRILHDWADSADLDSNFPL
jgi:hypothetical protein